MERNIIWYFNIFFFYFVFQKYKILIILTGKNEAINQYLLKKEKEKKDNDNNININNNNNNIFDWNKQENQKKK